MQTREKTAAGAIVHAGQRALVVRSAALVARGLRDLTRDSNWVVKKIFTGYSAALAISSIGPCVFHLPRISTRRTIPHGRSRPARGSLRRGIEHPHDCALGAERNRRRLAGLSGGFRMVAFHSLF